MNPGFHHHAYTHTRTHTRLQTGLNVHVSLPQVVFFFCPTPLSKDPIRHYWRVGIRLRSAVLCFPLEEVTADDIDFSFPPS